MLQRTVIALAAAACVALLARPVSAQNTDTDQFEASIDIQTTCNVEVNDLNFGIVDDLTGAVTSTTTGSVECSINVPAGQITFDVGDGGGNFQTRRMAQEQAIVAYNIYRDAGHTEILGDGTNGTVPIAIAAANTESVEFTVYGRTEPNQNVEPGEYTSTITATLRF